MIEEVQKAFQNIWNKNIILGGSGDFIVDGYQNFVFLTRKKRRLYMPNTISQRKYFA